MKYSTERRRLEIIKKLNENGVVSSIDLSVLFQVSMETIRKDLKALENEKIAIKEYGGAYLSGLDIEKKFEDRSLNIKQKAEIAKFAIGMLKDKKVLILDSGSTCLMVANELNSISPMDIITNSLRAFETIDGSKHQVFLTGGKKREKNQSMIGSWSVQFIRSIHADICFLGTSGIMDRLGPTAHSYQELEVKQEMIRQSDLVFVLADSSKFTQSGLHTVCDWNEIDGIITDNYLPLKIFEKYRKRVPIYMAEEDNNEENSKN